VSAFASVITPFDATPAIELGNQWRKRILPIGEIEYQGRQLRFTRSYLQGLVAAWQARAYDQVPLQFADARNTHTNDPERTRGWITSMELGDDGLYVTAELTERGQRTLADNPYLGVSARIVEQFQRSDGEYFPAAVQHVLATLDPRIPGLGAWQPVEMSNESAVVIDLSNLTFAGGPLPAPAGILDSLTERELDEFLDAVTEAEEEAATMPYDDSYRAAAEGFDAAFNERYAADQAREDARAAAMVQDLMHPAKRDEDRMARLMSRAADGVYDGQQISFAADEAAVELAMATGHGPCGPPDEFGRCSARYHDLDCAHQVSVDWLASGPPASTGQAALSNLADRMALDLSTRTVWGDPDGDEPSYEVPDRVVELASELATDRGLGDVPSGFLSTGYQELMRPPAPQLTAADSLYEDMGYGRPVADQPARPGISELAKSLGLKR